MTETRACSTGLTRYLDRVSASVARARRIGGTRDHPMVGLEPTRCDACAGWHLSQLAAVVAEERSAALVPQQRPAAPPYVAPSSYTGSSVS